MSEARLVLVADDEPDIVELVRFRLERAGYRVAAAGDGEEALRLAERERPDLFVLDVMMPGMDGLELTRRLRASEELRGVPIILLTASVQGGAVAGGFEAGTYDFMRKPFSPAELLDRVEAALGR